MCLLCSVFSLVFPQMVVFHLFTAYIWYLIYNGAFLLLIIDNFISHSFYPWCFWEKVRYLLKIQEIFLCMKHSLNRTVLCRLQPSSLTVSPSSFDKYYGTCFCTSFLCKLYYAMHYINAIYTVSMSYNKTKLCKNT